MANLNDVRKNLRQYLNDLKQGKTLDITSRGRYLTTLIAKHPHLELHKELRFTPLINRVHFGAHTYDGENSNLNRFDQLQDSLTKKLSLFHIFRSHNTPWAEIEAFINFTNARYAQPLITWQPRLSLEQIIAGEGDRHLEAWAKGASQVKSIIYIRPFPEMNIPLANGTWGQKDPEKFLLAWHYVLKIFKQHNAHNVKWIWSPNCKDECKYKLECYFPGQGGFDILATDGYNWGGDRWRSFDDTFKEIYDRLIKLEPQKPVWITETGCAEEGNPQRKADWIKEMFASTLFPNLQALIWLDEDKTKEGERNWRINSSDLSLLAFNQNSDGPVYA